MKVIGLIVSGCRVEGSEIIDLGLVKDSSQQLHFEVRWERVLDRFYQDALDK